MADADNANLDTDCNVTVVTVCMTTHRRGGGVGDMATPWTLGPRPRHGPDQLGAAHRAELGLAAPHQQRPALCGVQVVKGDVLPL